MTAALSYQEFRSRLLRAALHTPNNEPIVAGDFGKLTGTDRVAARLLETELRALLPAAPAELLESIDSIDEAFGWYESGFQEDSPTPFEDDQVQRNRWTDYLAEMRTASSFLRPIAGGDIPLLYRSMLDPRWSYKWRYRGATPSMADFEQSLFHGVLTQMVVVDRVTAAICGVVSGYEPRLDSSHCQLAITRVTAPDPNRPMAFLSGVALFISFLFRNWNFRKLYAEIPGVTWPQFEFCEGTIFDVDAVLTERDFFDGQYLDARIVSIKRDTWARTIDDFQHLL